jgi:HAD superfamily hydrolase (TIGR01509 family)
MKGTLTPEVRVKVPLTSAFRVKGTSMPQLQAVLFDMDGLLVDTEPLWFEVELDVMARLGGEWTAADQVAVLGSPSSAAARYMVERSGSDTDPAEVGRWMDEGIVRRVRERVAILPGALDLLEDLHAAGVACGLVSASVRPMVDAVLARVGTRHFAVTISGDDVSHNKPDPEPYLKAIAALGADPSRCVVLEDSPNGVAAGLASGCRVVAVPHAATIQPAERLQVVQSLAQVSAASLEAFIAT